MNTWSPITLARLNELIEQQLSDCSEEVRAIFKKYRVTPVLAAVDVFGSNPAQPDPLVRTMSISRSLVDGHSDLAFMLDFIAKYGVYVLLNAGWCLLSPWCGHLVTSWSVLRI